MANEEEQTVPELVEELARLTNIYTQMMTDGFTNGEEFAHIEQRILSLQKTILIKQGVDVEKLYPPKKKNL
jgi:hypothetical protein